MTQKPNSAGSGSEAHHQDNGEREQNRGKANGKRECGLHGIPLCDKDALGRVNESETQAMTGTVLGAEPDNKDQSRRKEKGCDADSRGEDENEEAAHNRQLAMAAVKEGESQTVKLPWPPSTNSLWRAVRGKNIRSEAYRKWLDAAGWELAAQRPKEFIGPVSLLLRLTPPTRQAFDLDNRCKATIDLLVAHRVIESDDCNIVREITVALGDAGAVGVTIEITAYQALIGASAATTGARN